MVGGLTNKYPRHNQSGKRKLSCHWCGKQIDYSNLCTIGPYCSMVCMSAKLVYVNLSAAFVFSFCGLYFWDSFIGLLLSPSASALQASFVIAVFFVLPVLLWVLGFYGWIVRRRDPTLRIPPRRYHPDMRA